MDLHEELEILKAAFCSGDEAALRKMLRLAFPELWANMLKGNLNEQTDALFAVEMEIKQEAAEFCADKLPVITRLRKIWKEKLAALRKRESTFEEGYMKPVLIPAEEEIKTDPKGIIPLALRYMMASFKDDARILFEVKYLMELSGKRGLFQLAKYLLNVASIGNDYLQQALQANTILHEPVLSRYLTQHGVITFVKNKDVKTKQGFTNLLEKLRDREKDKRSEIKKAFHRIDMQVARDYRKFHFAYDQVKHFTEVEQAILFMDEFLNIKAPFEVWTKLNIDAVAYKPLLLELEAGGLVDERIKPHYAEHRTDEILDKLKLSQNRQEVILNFLSETHANIDKKINRSDLWKMQ